MRSRVTWLPSFGFPRGWRIPRRAALLDSLPTADLASRLGLQPLRAESNQNPKSCESWVPVSELPPTGLSHCCAMPDMTLLFCSSYQNETAFEAAIHKHEHVQLFHNLLSYKIQPVSCLSPAGYSTVLQDSVVYLSKHPITL